jgi:sugar lactone lactonase YvrE
VEKVMKKFGLVLFFISICTLSLAEGSLFDYRGVFPADRKDEAAISNYMLLKKARKIRFEIEEAGKGLTEKVKIVAVKLTSDPKVNKTDPNGISRIELPETGIYEILLKPHKNAGGEIKFILRVFEDTGKISEEKISEINNSDENSSSTEQKVQDFVATEANEIKTSPRFDLSKAMIVSDKVEEKEEESQTDLPLASETIVEPVATLSMSVTTIDSNKVIILDDEKEDRSTKPKVLDPLAGSYVNAFSGIKVSSLPDPDKHFEVSYLNREGQKVAVKGSFFPGKNGETVFFPENLIPGAVIHIGIQGIDSLENDKLRVFPELKASLLKVDNGFKLTYFWEQNQTLAPNPMGQVLKLSNSRILIKSGENEVLKIDLDKNRPPFFYEKGCAFKSKPYFMEITVPEKLIADFESPLLAILQIKVGSTDQYTEVSRVSGKNDSGNTAANGNSESVANIPDDFSDVPAQLPDEKATELLDVGDALNLDFFKSFKISLPGKDTRKIWPHEMALDESSNIWILDSQLRMVYCFNPGGNLVLSFGQSGKENENLGFPKGIYHSRGMLYISDGLNRRIHKYSVDGIWRGAIEAGNERLHTPGGICFREPELWVVDKARNKLVCYDRRGKYLGNIDASLGAEFKNPVAIQSGKENLYVLEKQGVVKVISPMGQKLWEFSSGCKNAKSFWVDSWDYVWICDEDGFQVKRFSSKGKLLTRINPPPGPKPWIPTCVTVSGKGLVAIADAQAKKVYLFKIKN